LKNTMNSIWEKNKIKAFWDRPNLDYDTWYHRVKDARVRGHLRDVRISFKYMGPTDIMRLLGSSTFVNIWGKYRNDIETPYKILLDGRWGACVSGNWIVGYNENLKLMRPSVKEIFDIVADEPMCVYHIAKRLQRPYRRVHSGVKRLIELGICSKREVIINGRISYEIMVIGVNDIV